MPLAAKQSTVNEMIAHVLCIDSATIKPTSLLSEDLGADSLDRQELASLIEENFGIQLIDDIPQGWRTVSDVMDDVYSLVQMGEGASKP